MNAQATVDEADLTRRAGVSIMAVAVGNWLNINVVRAMVSYWSERNTLRVDNYESLGDVVYTVRDAVCGSQYRQTLSFVLLTLLLSVSL